MVGQVIVDTLVKIGLCVPMVVLLLACVYSVASIAYSIWRRVKYGSD